MVLLKFQPRDRIFFHLLSFCQFFFFIRISPQTPETFLFNLDAPPSIPQTPLLLIPILDWATILPDSSFFPLPLPLLLLLPLSPPLPVILFEFTTVLIRSWNPVSPLLRDTVFPSRLTLFPFGVRRATPRDTQPTVINQSILSDGNRFSSHP